MPKLKDIYEMMKAQQTPYIAIYNLNKERIFTFRENDNVESTIQQMEGLMPFISSYGRVLVEASTEAMKARSFANSYKWTLEFERAAAPGTNIAAPANPWQQLNVPNDYMHKDVVAAQLATINARLDHEKEMRKLQDQIKANENADPMKNIEKIAPAFLYLMGKPLEEVKTFAALYSGASAGAAGMAGPPANALVMKDVENLTPEESKIKCQQALDALGAVMSRQHMIILCTRLTEKLKTNPAFIETILMYI